MDEPDEPNGGRHGFALRQVDGRGELSNCGGEMELRARKRARESARRACMGQGEGWEELPGPGTSYLPAIALTTGRAGPGRVLGGPLLPVSATSESGTCGALCAMGHEKYILSGAAQNLGGACSQSFAVQFPQRASLGSQGTVGMFPLCLRCVGT